MSWNYVNADVDHQYSKPLPDAIKLSADDLPTVEFNVRELLATWLLNSFVPFDSLTALDKIVSRKNYRKLEFNLSEQTQQICMLISKDEAARSALIRIISAMPDNAPQKRYLTANVLRNN